MSGEPSETKHDGRSGRILVLSMVGGAIILGLVALKYRQFPPTDIPPASEPTTNQLDNP